MTFNIIIPWCVCSTGNQDINTSIGLCPMDYQYDLSVQRNGMCILIMMVFSVGCVSANTGVIR